MQQGCGCLVIILVGFLCYSSCTHKEDEEKPINHSHYASDNSEEDLKISTAWIMAQHFVQEELKCPSTSKFPSYGASKSVKYLGNGEYKVTSYVDAENSFGAMVRTNYEITIKNTHGETWETMGATIYW